MTNTIITHIVTNTTSITNTIIITIIITIIRSCPTKARSTPRSSRAGSRPRTPRGGCTCSSAASFFSGEICGFVWPSLRPRSFLFEGGNVSGTHSATYLGPVNKSSCPRTSRGNCSRSRRSRPWIAARALPSRTGIERGIEYIYIYIYICIHIYTYIYMYIYTHHI